MNCSGVVLGYTKLYEIRQITSSFYLQACVEHENYAYEIHKASRVQKLLNCDNEVVVLIYWTKQGIGFLSSDVVLI